VGGKAEHGETEDDKDPFLKIHKSTKEKREEKIKKGKSICQS